MALTPLTPLTPQLHYLLHPFYSVLLQLLGAGADVEHEVVEGKIGLSIHFHEAHSIIEVNHLKTFVCLLRHLVEFALPLRGNVEVSLRDGIEVGGKHIFQMLIGLDNLASVEPLVILLQNLIIRTS